MQRHTCLRSSALLSFPLFSPFSLAFSTWALTSSLFPLSRFRCLPLLPSSLTCYFSPSFLEFASYPDYPSSALPPPFRPLIFVRPPQLLHSSPIFPASPTVRIHLIHPIPLIELIPLPSVLFGSLVFAMNSGSLSLFFSHQEQIKEEE